MLVIPASNSQLLQSWCRAWNSLGIGKPDEKCFNCLLVRYEETHRHYHTLQHLTECIEKLEPVLDLARHPGEVEIALWFHDAVYDLQANDNEQRSAKWARQAALDSGVSSAVADRIHRLVMATQHATPLSSPDEQLLADVDLLVLGETAWCFDAYERQVREEYAHVPEALYRQKRCALLRSFLARPYIYHTAWFRDSLELAARENLQRLLARFES